MVFLYFDVIAGKVLCSPEAMTRPEVQKLYQADKSKDKSHFNAVCTAVYWIYKPRNIYWNKSVQERIKIVNEDYLRPFQTTWEQLAKETGVKAFTESFVDLSQTINDRADQNLRNDFEALMGALNDVPTKVDVDIPAGVDALCEDGKVRKLKKAVKVTIPNFSEKAELWKQYESFSKILKNIQAFLKIEEAERSKEGENTWLYDDPNKVQG